MNIAVIMFSLLLIVMVISYQSDRVENLRRDAIRAGVAEYQLTGEYKNQLKFVWKPCNHTNITK